MGQEITVEEVRFRKRLVALLCCTVFFSVLNGTMFNVAIPDIARQFVLTPSEVSWVVTGYIVIFALGAVTFGKLADIYPVRNLITAGLLLFNAGALIGFLSGSYSVLIAGRFIQAAGGSAIPALSMLVATRYVPPDRRGRVLGAVASTVAFAAGVGPIIGGFIAGTLHWRYLFLLSNATLLAIPLYRLILLPEQRKEDSFDLGGALLLAVAVAQLLIAITQRLLWLVPSALIVFAIFVRHIHRRERPFVHPSLFRGSRFRAGLATAFLAVGTVFGMMFQVPLMLRQLNGLETEAIGLVIFPGAMSAAILGFQAGKVADRHGSVTVVHAGLGTLIAGHLLLSFLAGSGRWAVALGLIVIYCGFSFIHASLAKTVSLILPHERAGVGMGVYNMVFFLAGAFGAAITGRLLETLAAAPPLNPWAPAGAAAYSGVFVVAAATVLLAALLFRRAFGSGKHLEPE